MTNRHCAGATNWWRSFAGYPIERDLNALGREAIERAHDAFAEPAFVQRFMPAIIPPQALDDDSPGLQAKSR